MAKNFKWRTTFIYKNSLDPNYHLSYGAVPNTYDTWQTAEIGSSGSNTTTYFYRDSNTMYAGEWVDTISSRVAYSVTQSWTTSVDSRNNLTVSVTTVVNSVVRDDVRGNDQNTPGRNINVYREDGGSAYISTTDNLVATAHTISGSVSLGTYTFTLAPGQDLTRNTLYIHNQTVGSGAFDDIWAGVQFQNPLPAETIPGAVYDGSSKWLSHNRAGGDLRIWNGSRWTDNLANIDGGAGVGDPPSLYHDSKWYNQRTFGFE